jgi:hypothetical protein
MNAHPFITNSANAAALTMWMSTWQGCLHFQEIVMAIEIETLRGTVSSNETEAYGLVHVYLVKARDDMSLSELDWDVVESLLIDGDCYFFSDLSSPEHPDVEFIPATELGDDEGGTIEYQDGPHYRGRSGEHHNHHCRFTFLRSAGGATHQYDVSMVGWWD